MLGVLLVVARMTVWGSYGGDMRSLSLTFFFFAHAPHGDIPLRRLASSRGRVGRWGFVGREERKHADR